MTLSYNNKIEKMTNKDYILPFMISNQTANGRIVCLNESVQKIISLHEYPKAVSNLLAELLVVSCFLGQNLKKEGTITCQIQSKDGLIRLLVTEYMYGGGIRGYAGFEEAKFTKENYSFQELIGSGQLVVTFESGEEKYQGIIELGSESLAKSFESYLGKSEQIKSVVSIAIKETNILDERNISANGIILKKMPSDDEDAFVTFTHFIKSVSKEELLETDSEELLKRLFHSDGVILYDKSEVHFKCRCDRAKMENALSAIPKNELESLKVDGKIVIKCQFCSNEEFFE